MLYLIGLGLNSDGITKEGLDALQKCKRVYLENYTVDFPYSAGELKDKLNLKKIILANREKVESLEIVDEAKKLNIALLIYGAPLIATTHISLIQEAKICKIKYKIIYSASVIDAVSETGLQIYKFGKIASMPKWQKNYEPDSFIKIVKDNLSIESHSLILVDIGLDVYDALNQLEIATKNNDIKLNKIIICQSLGTNKRKIFYRNFDELREFDNVRKPYCIIIPGKLHFIEKEVLEGFS